MTVELIANSPTPGSSTPIATLATAVITTPAAGTIETWTFSSAPPAALQAAGQYRFTIDSEICIDVTGGGGASRQIQRGAEGSSVATHLQGAGIYHGITAGGLANWVATNASVALINAPNVFTADTDAHIPISILPHSTSQSASLLRVGNGGSNWYGPPNAMVDIYEDTTDAVDARPVMVHIRRDVDPVSTPTISTDYHAIDLLVNSSSANIVAATGHVGFYPFETNAQYTGSGSIDRMVAAYAYTTAGAVGVATGVNTDMTSLQALQRNLGTGTVALSRGVYLRTPVNSGGGTITEHRQLHIETPVGVTGITTAYAIKVDGGQSYHSGRFVIGPSAGPTTTNTSLIVQAQGTGSTETAARFQSISGGSTSATLVAFTDSSNNPLISIPWGAGGLNIDTNAANTALKAGAGVAIRVPAAKVPLYIIQAATPSQPIVQIQNSTPTDVFRIESNGDITRGDATNFIFGTTTGTKIGTGTTQKIGFYNAAPVVQPSGTPIAATDLASVITLANSLRTNLLALGLVA